MPTYLFSRTRSASSYLRRRMKNAERLCIFLDYDGTLVPIRRHPSEAVMSIRVRSLLHKIATLPGVTVGIVTGRSLADIQSIVGIREVAYFANHGFETCIDGINWIHPAGLEIRPSLNALAVGLKVILSSIKNVGIEDKGSTLSVHYRNVKNSSARWVRAKVKACVQGYGGSLKDAGQAIGKSKDGGIDGGDPEFDQSLADPVEMGLVVDSGQRRFQNGKWRIVWVAVPPDERGKQRIVRRKN